ncbi:MAG TPA: LCP family protein [Candidatus Limnocylindria bacterium]
MARATPRPIARRRRAPLTFGLAAVLALVAGCAAGATPSAPATAQPTARPTSRPTATPSPTPTPAPTPEPTPTRPILDESLLHSRLTVLVLGEDSSQSRRNSGYRNSNTDSIMVVSLSRTQSEIVALSLPRDTVDIPLDDGRVYSGKVNGMKYYLGIEGMRAAMESLLGVEIDAYVKVDMDDLVRLVDAVGGIDVEVKTHVRNAKLYLDLAPGPAHLSGATALAYSRNRNDGDYARAARQQQVVLALVAKYADPASTVDVATLLPTLGSLETNLDLANLPTLLAMARRASDAAVTGTVLGPPRFALFEGFEPGTARGWVMIPNVSEIRAYAQALIGD